MHRRLFIKNALTLTAIGLIGTGCTPSSHQMLVSAARDSSGNHSIRLIDPYRDQSTIIPVAERLHDATLRPGTAEIVVFERRPGYRFYVIDVKRAQISKSIPATNQRHLYGHGAFSQNGKWLYTTENNLSSLNGVIGIYDAEQSYARVGEWPLPLPGPHEIKLMPDGETLVVAVGGIKTHPDSERKTLNPDSLQPSLIYLNRHSGQIVDQQSFIDPYQSIRHLDIASDGTVVIGMQYQGSNDDALPLVATHQRGNPIKAIDAQPEQWLALNGYIASVAVLSETDTIAVTSPRGNRITLIQKSTGQLKSFIYQRDCAGIASLAANRLAVSNGLGEVQILKCFQGQAKTVYQSKHIDCRWDNHMLVV